MCYAQLTHKKLTYLILIENPNKLMLCWGFTGCSWELKFFENYVKLFFLGGWGLAHIPRSYENIDCGVNYCRFPPFLHLVGPD